MRYHLHFLPAHCFGSKDFAHLKFPVIVEHNTCGRKKNKNKQEHCRENMLTPQKWILKAPLDTIFCVNSLESMPWATLGPILSFSRPKLTPMNTLTAFEAS